jgi:hypothetical protein
MLNFEYSDLGVYLSYHCRDIIKEFMLKHKNDHKYVETKDYLYFDVPSLFNTDSEEVFKFFWLKNEPSDLDAILKQLDKANLRAFIKARDADGFSLTTNRLNYTGTYLYKLESIYPELADSLRKKYQETVNQDSVATDIAIIVDDNIDFFKEWVKKNKQFKKTNKKGVIVDNSKIKRFNDLDYSIYSVADNILNISCIASSTIYSCVFTEYGYKVYGSFDKTATYIEQSLFPDTEVDEEQENDTLFLKHCLNDKFLILEMTKDRILPYDDLLVTLSLILRYSRIENDPSYIDVSEYDNDCFFNIEPTTKTQKDSKDE